MIEKLDMKTPDFTNENIAQIAALFPNCLTETKDENGNLKKAIDFDLLKQELSGNIVDGVKERYSLNWPGKKEALVTANKPINKTFRPDVEDSVNFDTTQNLYIEGDNLEALKLLQESYLNKIKMIYIDPPYNTGKDFVYKDNFTGNKDEELEKSGQISEEGRLVSNLESNGRYHSDWLSMMYPRLKLARNLLKEDGVIVIHIDENEYPNLEKILSEVFGEDNNLGTIVWDKRNPKGEVAGVAQQHELISIYCKNKILFKEKSELKRPKENADKMLKKASQLIISAGEINESVRSEFKKWLSKQNFSGGELAYKFIDDNGDIYQPVSMAAPDKPETRSHRPLFHPITFKECPVPAKGWRFPDKSMDKLLENNEILFGENETTQPRRKYLLKENLYENVPSLLYFGGSDNALSLPFDNPKPVSVALKIIQSTCEANEIVLDFFSGSSTTAHATMKLNSEDNGNRKYIMVQLPEETAEKSQARKEGYDTIPQIAKDRIRRAGRNIVEESRNDDLDIGFRVLKIDSSNMNDVYYTPEEITQDSLFDVTVDNIKPDRKPLDLLFQVLLDSGVDLTLPIIKKEILGKEVYFVDENVMVACFEDSIDELFVTEIAKMNDILKVVFKDSSFKSDDMRINVEQIFKQYSPDTDLKVI